MNDPLALLPFEAACPKCLNRASFVGWCRSCDEQLEAEHLHRLCASCGARRLSRCADADEERRHVLEILTDQLDAAALSRAAEQLMRDPAMGVPAMLLATLAGAAEATKAKPPGGAA